MNINEKLILHKTLTENENKVYKCKHCGSSVTIKEIFKWLINFKER